MTRKVGDGDPRWPELFMMISDIADEALLWRRWAGLIPNTAASPQEDIALIFDSFGIEEAVSRTKEELGLSLTQYRALREVHGRLNAFLDGVLDEEWHELSYREVLVNPDWQKVVVAARTFINSLSTSS